LRDAHKGIGRGFGERGLLQPGGKPVFVRNLEELRIEVSVITPRVHPGTSQPRAIACPREADIYTWRAHEPACKNTSALMSAWRRIARSVPSGISPGWFGIVV